MYAARIRGFWLDALYKFTFYLITYLLTKPPPLPKFFTG